jgi:type VI secretion system secreted protein Hcp
MQALQGDFYLNVDGIKGECQDEEFKENFQLSTWNFRCSNPGSPLIGSGAGIGKSVPQDLYCTGPINAGSTKLWQACAEGTPIKTVKLVCRKNGTKGKLKYLEIVLTSCIVSSYQINGSNADELPSESFSFAYAKCEYNYTVQKPDGNPGGKMPGVYDFSKNVAK